MATTTTDTAAAAAGASATDIVGVAERLFPEVEQRADVEVEARLREVELVSHDSGAGGRPARVCRLPVLTQASLRRVRAALEASGDVESTTTTAYSNLVVELIVGNDAPGDTLKCALRVEFPDAAGASTDKATLADFFANGCSFSRTKKKKKGGDGGGFKLKDAWRARQLKCTFGRDDGGDAPVRVSMALELGAEDVRKRFSKRRRKAAAAAAAFVPGALEEPLRIMAELSADDVKFLDASRFTRRMRHVTRTSLHLRGGRVRVDLSAVRMTATSTPVVAVDPPFAEYEAEVEWVGPMDDLAAAARAVRAEATRLARVVLSLGADAERAFPPRAHALAAGPTVAPRAVSQAMPAVRSISSLDDLCGTTHYTEKADGVTAFLAVAWDDDGGTPVVLTDDAALAHARVARALAPSGYARLEPAADGGADEGEGDFRRNGSVTVLQGEYVTDPAPVFLVFDALVVGDAPVHRTENLVDRLARAEAVVGALAPREGGAAAVRMKEMVPIGAERPIAYAGNAPALVAQRGYRTDGLVFMGGGPLNRRGFTRPPVVKWKPADEQTVDLLVHYDVGSRRCFFMCADTIEAELGGRARSRYTYRPYAPPAGVELPDPTDFRDYGDGAVVEFRLGDDGTRLTFVRVREDKTARYIRSMRSMRRVMEAERNGHWRVSWARHLVGLASFQDAQASLMRFPLAWLGRHGGRDRGTFAHGANNRRVIDETLALAADEGRYGLAFLNEQRTAGIWAKTYFARSRRTMPSLAAMIRMNNRAKEAVLRAAVEVSGGRGGGGGEGRLFALDLACGEGNDLPRWAAVDEKVLGGGLCLTGMDVDRCAVVEARRRSRLPRYRGLCARFLVGGFGLAGEGFFSPDAEQNAAESAARAAATPPDGTYALVTVFFAIHYANVGEAGLARVMRAAAGLLRPGGACAVTFMDADDVQAHLPQLDHEGHFRIAQDPEDKARWLVRLEGIGREHPEPKLRGSDLHRAAEAAGLSCEKQGALADMDPDGETSQLPGETPLEAPEKALAGTYKFAIYKKGQKA